MEPVQFLRTLTKITIQNSRYKNMLSTRDIKTLLNLELYGMNVHLEKQL